MAKKTYEIDIDGQNTKKTPDTSPSNKRFWKWSLVSGGFVLAVAGLLTNIDRKSEVEISPQPSSLNIATAPKWKDIPLNIEQPSSRWGFVEEVNNTNLDKLDIFIQNWLLNDPKKMFEEISKLDKEQQNALLQKFIKLWLFSYAIDNFQSFSQLSKLEFGRYMFSEYVKDYWEIFTACLQKGLFSKEELRALMMSGKKNPNKWRAMENVDMFVDGDVFTFLISLKGWAQEDLLLSYWEYAKFLTEDQKRNLYDFAVSLTLKDSNRMVTFDVSLSPNTERISWLQEYIWKWEYWLIWQYLRSDDPIDKRGLLSAMISTQEYIAIIQNSKILGVLEGDIYQYAILALNINKPEGVIWLAGQWYIPIQLVPNIFAYMTWKGISIAYALMFPNLHGFLPNKDQLVETIIQRASLGSYLSLAIDIQSIRPNKSQTQRILEHMLRSEDEILRSYTWSVMGYYISLG